MKHVIAYHGTVARRLASILREGFRVKTYFAYRKQDAIARGGPYVFTVRLSGDPNKWQGEPDGWQFHLRNPLSPNVIQTVEYMEVPDVKE